MFTQAELIERSSKFLDEECWQLEVKESHALNRDYPGSERITRIVRIAKSMMHDPIQFWTKAVQRLDWKDDRAPEVVQAIHDSLCEPIESVEIITFLKTHNCSTLRPLISYLGSPAGLIGGMRMKSADRHEAILFHTIDMYCAVFWWKLDSIEPSTKNGSNPAE